MRRKIFRGAWIYISYIYGFYKRRLIQLVQSSRERITSPGENWFNSSLAHLKCTSLIRLPPPPRFPSLFFPTSLSSPPPVPFFVSTPPPPRFQHLLSRSFSFLLSRRLSGVENVYDEARCLCRHWRIAVFLIRGGERKKEISARRGIAKRSKSRGGMMMTLRRTKQRRTLCVCGEEKSSNGGEDGWWRLLSGCCSFLPFRRLIMGRGALITSTDLCFVSNRDELSWSESRNFIYKCDERRMRGEWKGIN